MGQSSSKSDSILIDMLNENPLNENQLNEKYSFINKYGKAKYDFILNLLLVKYGARKAYLFETTNYIGISHDEKDIPSFLKIISDSDLYYQLELQSIPYRRYFVSKEILKNIPKNHEQIGQLLGFKDPGGNFYDYTQKRIGLSIKETITGVNIMAELLLHHRNMDEIDEYAREKVNSFNRVMTHLNLPYNFVYEITHHDGSIKHLEELKKNLKYLNDNSTEYIDDLENAVGSDEDPLKHPIISIFKECLKDKKLLKKYLPVFEYIYELYNDIEDEDHQRRLNRINRYLIEFLLN